MASQPNPSAGAVRRRLDSKRYLTVVEQTRAAAARALAEYGEPALDLAELRRRLTECSGTESLTEWILEDRRSTW